MEARITDRAIKTFPSLTNDNRFTTITTPRGEEAHTHNGKVFPDRKVRENRALTDIIGQIGDSTNAVTDSGYVDTMACFCIF